MLLLTQELRAIPKKTRIKVDDGWKEVFQFDVPEWQEQDGKEDQGRIRRDIEKWLQSKQLLKIVIKDKEIKVKCRKVTNDSRVSNSIFS